MESLSKTQLAVVQRALDRACANTSEVQLALLASVDGFQLAAAGSKSHQPELPEKFAAMASSMTALSEAAGKELAATMLDIVVLDFKGLQMILRKVRGGPYDLVLAFAASKSMVLGNLLWTVRECAQGVEEALRSSERQ